MHLNKKCFTNSWLKYETFMFLTIGNKYLTIGNMLVLLIICRILYYNARRIIKCQTTKYNNMIK